LSTGKQEYNHSKIPSEHDVSKVENGNINTVISCIIEHSAKKKQSSIFLKSPNSATQSARRKKQSSSFAEKSESCHSKRANTGTVHYLYNVKECIQRVAALSSLVLLLQQPHPHRGRRQRPSETRPAGLLECFGVGVAMVVVKN
jgi:hypothetical protein